MAGKASTDAQLGPHSESPERLPSGRFAPGNRLSVGNRGNAQGNPVHRRMRALQGWIVESVTREQVREVMQKLYEMARNGDVLAARVFLERACGKPHQEQDGVKPVGAQFTFVLPGPGEIPGPKQVVNETIRRPDSDKM